MGIEENMGVSTALEDYGTKLKEEGDFGALGEFLPSLYCHSCF